MTKVLILSSHVAAGHVGLGAAVPVLQAFGHRATALPTVVLSNHPGFPRAEGLRVPPARLRGMIGALEANGWLADHDALLTGYLPTAGHVAVAAELAAQLSGRMRICVDPIVGDVPGGLYIARAAAAALRDRLAPLADLLTPNLFELGWLTGRPTGTLPEATDAARSLLGNGAEIVVTSPPLGPGESGLLVVARETAEIYRTRRYPDVPHGTGDVLAALMASGLRPGAALGHLDALIGASRGAPHLAIVETAPRWTKAPPIARTEIPWPSTSS